MKTLLGTLLAQSQAARRFPRLLDRVALQPAQTMAANSDHEKMMKECAEMMKDAQQRENVQ